MKNSNLIKRLQVVKNDKSIEIIEGFVLTTVKGGGCTKVKCQPNCGSNSVG